MPQLVLIGPDSRIIPGIQELGDFIEVCEDDVELGNGMLAFDQIQIKGLDISIVRDLVNFTTERGSLGRANFVLNTVQRTILASIPGVAATKIKTLQDSVIARA